MIAAVTALLNVSSTMTNHTKRVASVALAATIYVMSLSTADASSCQNPNVVQIRIPRGAYCWVYEGTATHFRGGFGRGQRLQVEMSGPANAGSPRDISVSAPNRAVLPGYGQAGLFDTTLPVSGTYEIGFGPCYLWHSYGRVVICAR